MAETNPTTDTSSPAGDAAVDGFLSGIVAGVGMIAYLSFVGMLAVEWPATMLGRFDIRGGANPLVGGLIHLSVSGFYGILFGIGNQLSLRRWFATPPRWLVALLGLAYGSVLLLIARFILLPSSGAPLEEVGSAHLAIAHLIYGIALSVLFERMKR